MSTLAQLVGFVLLILGGLLLWSPWALVVGGGLLVLVPEIASARRRAITGRTSR